MIRKIVCPSDFSKPAQNAVEYAAAYASVCNAELLLVNVQQMVPVAFAVSLDVNPEAPVLEKSKTATKALRELSADIRSRYKIECSYEVDLTAKSLEESLLEFEGEHTLYIMGTDGAERFAETLFGSHTYKVIRRMRSPLLLLPAEFRFNPIRRVLFVAPDGDNDHLPLQSLWDTLDVFNPEYTFFATGSAYEFELTRQQAQGFFGKRGPQITYWHRQTDDVESSVLELVQQEKFDLVAIQEQDRSVIQKLFKPDPVKEISANADYPVLVLHSPRAD